MSIGSSGRIVIEIDPYFKKELYSVLKKEGLSLKEWFLKGAEEYVSEATVSGLKMDSEGLSHEA